MNDKLNIDLATSLAERQVSIIQAEIFENWGVMVDYETEAEAEMLKNKILCFILETVAGGLNEEESNESDPSKQGDQSNQSNQSQQSEGYYDQNFEYKKEGREKQSEFESEAIDDFINYRNPFKTYN